MTANIDLKGIEKGLLHPIKYVSESLAWMTEEGHSVHKERQKASDIYDLEMEAILLAIKNIKSKLSDNIVLIDLGSSMNHKAINCMKELINGSPDRQIYYVPIDLGDHITQWRSYLQQEAPTVNQAVVHISPIVGDMLQALENMNEHIPPSYEQWEVLFIMIGPTFSVLTQEYAVNVLKKVNDICKHAGKGRLCLSYDRLTDQTEELEKKVFFDKIDIPGWCQAILLGLNEITEANFDLSAFEYSYAIKKGFTTPNVEGKFGGMQLLAKAKKNMTIQCAKLGLDVSVEKNEVIRLSEDIFKGRYFEESYLKSLAEKTKFQVDGNWTDSINLMSCIVLYASKQ